MAYFLQLGFRENLYIMSKSTTAERGTLSIHTKNIFPIIKKFLYADQEVFLRELISNAVDATQKLRKLASLGEYKAELGETRVQVKLNPTAKTITVSDAGIGMSRDEVKRYINQIAFSGAEAFIEKYKQVGEKEIIGHFGLGFYSAFMVADKVELHSQSYIEKEEAVHWQCSGSTDFEMAKTVKKTRGTDVTLHISKDAEAFLEKDRISDLLKKYCQFLPVEIELEGEIINQTDPPWTRSPADTDEKAYTALYKRLYPAEPEPLLWIHLHVDYPFELNGILYFPPIGHRIQPERHSIQLYSRQVFITEKVEEVVPPFLQLLHGVIDSPDIPLNVSRSALQSDSRVKKIHSYITKKVADKLTELFNSDRKAFEKKWDDIGLFVKYGICSDDKFYEAAQHFLLLENCKGKYHTLAEYKEKTAPQQTNKKKELVFLYSTNKEVQYGLVEQASSRSYDALRMESPIDTHFISHMESKQPDLRWRRLDAASMDNLIEKDTAREATLDKKQQDVLVKLFESHIKETHKISTAVKAESGAEGDSPVSLLIPEFIGRMQNMALMNGQPKSLPDTLEVLLNTNHPLILQLSKLKDTAAQKDLVEQLYNLALLQQQRLRGEALSKFIARSLETLKESK